MPRASIGLGPARIGSGCCIALVMPVLITAALFFALGGSAIAAKSQSNKQKAVQAVKREIARKYPLLDAAPEVNVTNAHNTVECEAISNTRFICEWSASNELHEKATGSARVIVYSKGAEATLYNNKCTASFSRC